MIIGLDFECYYTSAYTLKKLSTEAYIRHPFFEVIGCSISINGALSTWYTQPEVPAALNAIDWSTTSLLCFNTLFDGAILAWVYGHYPRFYLDAMGMARALGKAYRGGSLGKVLATCGLGHKGEYVKQAINKRYADFTSAQLQEYGEYCCNDTDQTISLYKQLQPSFPDSEALIQDMNLRLFIEPTLHFDTDILQLHRADVIENKRQQLLKANELLDLPPKDTEEELIEQLRKILSSNEKFAALLISLGVDPPTKISPSNGKEIWAFAKTDPDFMELEEHEDSAVQALVAARVGTRSTIEETRAESFLDLATRGPIPVQYNYYGGHPGRFSGGGNCNFQNLKRGGKLRDAIIAPPGHFIICGDLSQIEARLTAYLAGQDDEVEAFRLHDIDPDKYPDVYCIAATKLYGRIITKANKAERQAGKAAILSCIAEGELVLTEAGLLPIEQVSSSLRVWDGENWVNHDGPVYRGERNVIRYQGLTATEDHRVWTRQGLLPFGTCAKQQIPLITTGLGRKTIRMGDGYIPDSTKNKRPSLFTNSLYWMRYRALASYGQLTKWKNKRLSSMFTASSDTIMVNSKTKRCMSTLYQSSMPTMEMVWATWYPIQIRFHSLCRVMDNGKYRIGKRQTIRSHRQQWTLRTRKFTLGHAIGKFTQYAAYAYRSLFSQIQIAVSRSALCGQYFASFHHGTNTFRQNSREVESTIRQTKRRVWDLLNCGPNHRFTVSGRLVHNCGFGGGWKAYKRGMYKESGIVVSQGNAQQVVDIYRDSHKRVQGLWREGDNALHCLKKNVPFEFGRKGILDGSTPEKGIGLPNKLFLNYPELRQEWDEKEKTTNWYYTTAKRGAIQKKKVYGSILTQNAIEALGRIILTDAWTRIERRGLRIVLHTHDELAGIVPYADVEKARTILQEELTRPVPWAPGLPITCEIKHGTSYGNAK